MILLLLAACGRDPTLLADMGEVDVSVAYDLQDGVHTADVRMAAAEGCPTFVGEGTFNGEPLHVAEEGHTEASGYYFVPTTECHTPHLGDETFAGVDRDEPLDVALFDDSATWTIGHEGAFTYAYAAPEGPFHVGDTLTFTWNGPGGGDVFLDGWQDDLGVYLPYEVDADGHVVATIGDDVSAGTLRIVIHGYLSYAPDVCEGPASCEVFVEHSGVFEVVVE